VIGVSTHTTVSMDTVVTLRVVGHDEGAPRHAERAAAIERAAGWFREIEATCNRFDPQSELRRLSERVGVAVPATPILFETLRFALALAAETDGAFDPTVGRRMEARGFDRDYRTGERRASNLAVVDQVTFRDVELDEGARTITLHRPLLLDLGAVAKGFAIDMAARELAELEHFAIDAGGDLYLAGSNERGEPWSVGIRHPRAEGELLETLRLSNTAVCTSGDYERASAAHGHHIVDPRTGDSAERVASATVIAPMAMVADGLATAAFVLGPVAGLSLLERHGVRGILFTPHLERYSTGDA
jgi:thiamine biosynthesis lipoprotein